MRIPAPDIRIPELKAFFISLICHAAVAQFFLLSIRPQAEAFQPNIIFLGSILRGNDFENLTAKRTLTDQSLPIIKITSVPNAFTSTRAVAKPAVKSKNPEEKIFLKPVLIKTPDEPSTKEEMQNLGIETTAPKRMPLKLDLK